MQITGKDLHEFCKDIFPICRSITGDGVRETLARINEIVPLTVSEVPSGTQSFDWIIPDEWNIRDAYIKDEAGNKIVDFQTNNLHVVGYSEPVDKVMPLDALRAHLHTLTNNPDAIPYVTSYYKRTWGFCITANQLAELPDQNYHVYIDSTLEPGHLTYGEFILLGQVEEEIFISTYVCHPSLANNEISGIAVATFIAKWLMQSPRYYSYRIVFVPETIGSITYISRNLQLLKQRTVAGFNLSCLGDERSYSVVSSRYANTIADKIARNIGSKFDEFKIYSFLERGSDERQYCAPGVDLPLVTLCRSRFGKYPEYHTSLDDLISVVTPDGLNGGFNYVRDCIRVLEANRIYMTTTICEPHLSRHGVYALLSSDPYDTTGVGWWPLTHFLAYADGTNTLLDIANILSISAIELLSVVNFAVEHNLIEAQS